MQLSRFLSSRNPSYSPISSSNDAEADVENVNAPPLPAASSHGGISLPDLQRMWPRVQIISSSAASSSAAIPSSVAHQQEQQSQTTEIHQNENSNNQNNHQNQNGPQVVLRAEDVLTPAQISAMHGLQDNLSKFLKQSSPFLLILFSAFLFEHIWGLFLFILFTSVIVSLGDSLKEQASLVSSQMSSKTMAIVIFGSLIHLAAGLYIARNDNIISYLLLTFPSPTVPLSFWNAIFMACFCDLCLRFASILVKSLVVFFVPVSAASASPSSLPTSPSAASDSESLPLPATLSPPPSASAATSFMSAKKRGHLLSTIENVSILFRHLIPIQIWMPFFADESRFGAVGAYICYATYLVFKCRFIFARARYTSTVTTSFLRLGTNPYGRYATEAEAQEAGGGCSICQEEFTSPPIRLNCGHIFCEPDIENWFGREATCPLCRVVVPVAGTLLHQDGSTSNVLIMF